MASQLLLFKPSVIKNGYFNEYTNYSWTQGGSGGEWTFYDGYVECDGGGVATLAQYGVLFTGVKYRITIKISDLIYGQYISIDLGGALTPMTDSATFQYDLIADSDTFRLVTSATFSGKISNVEVVEYPGSFELDIDPNFGFPISHSIDDLKDPATRATSLSRGTTLPATKRNNIAFNHIYEISGDCVLNPNKQCGAIVLENGIQTFRGVLGLDSIDTVNNGLNNVSPVRYNVTMIGTLGNIYSVWGDTSVRELDYSDYNHPYDLYFIKGNWNGYVYTASSGYLQNTEISYTSPPISGMSMVTYEGQDRVRLSFTSSHTFVRGDEVLCVVDNNNLLGGLQTIVDVTSTTITLNLFWSVLTTFSTPIGTVQKFRMLGFGYIYPMIEYGTVNGVLHDNNDISSGSLVVGKNYIIKDYVPSDVFSNVGGPSGNELGSQFYATGTTPTTWTNGSVLTTGDVNNWSVEEFYPAIFLKEVIDKSFELAGYRYDCPFFERPQFTRLIIPFSNGDDFNMSQLAQSLLVFRASMLNTISEPTGSTFESTYNLYPYPNISPYSLAISTFFPNGAIYTNTFPANTYAVASHHRISQTTGGGVTLPTGVIPFNNDIAPTDYDAGGTYDTVLYTYTQPAGYPELEYIFSFSGQCWHYIKNPTVYGATANPTGDLPSDYAGTGAPGIYAGAGVNGKLLGAVTVPLPSSIPVYDERTDVSFRPYNAIIFQKSTDGGSNWTSIKTLSANGLANGSYSEQYWNNTLVKGTADILLGAGHKVRIIFAATAKVIALRSDGRPCTGASRGGAAGTGIAAGGTGGPVTMTVRVDNAIFSNKLKSTRIREGLGFDMNSVLPNVKISDVFQTVIQKFNLLVEVDKIDDKLLRITPRDEYYDSTNPLDWSDKLDIATELNFKPMGDLNARNYVFSYTKDKDFFADDYSLNWSGFKDRVYGDKIYTVDNDFNTDTIEIKSVFQATPIVGPDTFYRGADRVISTDYNIDNNGVVKKVQSLKLLQYTPRGTDIPWNYCSVTGNFLSGNVMNVRWSDGDGDHFQFYPQATHLDNHLTPYYDINFGIPLATYYNADIYTERNLFNLYHKKYIEEITDRNSKILTLWLRLNAKDMLELDFSRLIFIHGHLLRLKKVFEYDVNSSGLTKCEFIKVKDRQ